MQIEATSEVHWRARFGERLTTARAAAAEIASGESLFIGMVSNTPHEFVRELVARSAELRGVSVYHHLAAFPWGEAAPRESLRHVTLFATLADRAAVNDGRSDYMPVGNWSESHLLRDHPPIDTTVVTLSPPDAEGYMSFGSCLWLNGVFARQARRVFAEIEPTAIRTAGDNRIHVSQIDRAWVREHPAPPRATRLNDPETDRVAEVICGHVARDLLKDGDCLQIGTGDVSARLARHLGRLNDIGVQTEILPTGVLDMVESGVITGRRKELAPGKVVASAILATPEEIRRADGHPAIELWDFTKTDDVRLLSRLSNFKAINNALEVDLSGQVTAETIGSRIYSGPGGQTAFAIAASYSDGGAAITVLPASTVVKGKRVSRIVPRLPGAVVTVPRTYVDYVVTEFGVAKLSGKTLAERVEALAEIAHPDFRDELRGSARRADQI